MKKVYVLLAQGFETVEALSQVDVCRRCKINVVTVSIDNNISVTSSHGIEIKANQLIKDTNFDDGDVIVLPGGFPGYMNLAESEDVLNVVKHYDEQGKIVAAICGAPYVLAVAGIAKGRRVTYHHSIKDMMEGYNYTGEKATIDGHLITGRGAGCSFDFAIAIMSQLCDQETITHLKAGLEYS
jgi:4-methyl-5(b-hydroxyethyl)-thiazole monophosphate biosynthesis